MRSSELKAVIKINGQDRSKDENGFNIVTLDYNTGRMEATENFDTESDGGGAKAMANFLLALKPGKVVLVATKGNANQMMKKEAYKALVSSSTFLSCCFKPFYFREVAELSDTNTQRNFGSPSMAV